MVSETGGHRASRSFYLVDANAPVLRLTVLLRAHGARGGDGLVVLSEAVAPRDIADRSAAASEDELLLPLMRLPQSPDLRVVLRADRQTHRLVARFAPRETVDLLRDLERRLAVPVFQLIGVGWTVDVDASVATADRLEFKGGTRETMERPKKLGQNETSSGEGLAGTMRHCSIHRLHLLLSMLSWYITTVSLWRQAANIWPNTGWAQSTRLISDEYALISVCI